MQDAAVALKGLLALAKQVIGEEGWTEAAGKASYAKFAKDDQDAFMEFSISTLFRQDYGEHICLL